MTADQIVRKLVDASWLLHDMSVSKSPDINHDKIPFYGLKFPITAKPSLDVAMIMFGGTTLPKNIKIYETNGKKYFELKSPNQEVIGYMIYLIRTDML